MSISASYINTASFSVSGDRVSEFSVGRRLKIDCGVDGFVYATVSSSSYVAPNTVVIIKDGVITSNIISVLYGIVSGAGDGSLPDHTHSSTEGTGGLVSFLDISGTPSSYDNTKYLRSTASGTEWVEVTASSGSGATTFLELTDTPTTYSGAEGYCLRTTASGIEFVELQTPPSTFLELTDTPTSYSGTQNLYLQSTGSGTQWAEVSSSSVNSFLDLSDTPESYIAGKYLKTTTSGLEFVSLNDLSLSVSGTTIGKQWFYSVGDIPANQPVYFLNETTGSISNFTYQSTGWLSDWTYRKKITIDNSNIDEDLTHFPLPIVISSGTGQSNQDLTDVFDELGSSYQKIAVTKADGTTQLYVEVEQWDNITEKALLWVSKDDFTVLSASDTELYIYYDAFASDNSSYVGLAGSTPAQNVWNSDFAAVYTMAQDPSGGAGCIKDSTSNANHGTPAGSMTSDDLVDGDIGKAVDFDGVDDRIEITTSMFAGLSLCSVSVTVKPRVIYDDGNWVYMNEIIASAREFYIDLSPTTGCVRVVLYYASSSYFALQTDYLLPTDTETRLYAVWDGATLILYVNGVLYDSMSALASAIYSFSSSSYIGWVDEYRFFNGLIQTITVQTSVSSAAWIKADYHAQFDNLLTFEQ